MGVLRSFAATAGTDAVDNAAASGEDAAADVLLLIVVTRIPLLSLMWCSRWFYAVAAAVGGADAASD